MADYHTFLKKALAMAPKPSEVYHALGRYFMELGRAQEAETALRQALEADPAGEEIILSLVELSLEQRAEEQEIHWWKTLLIQRPEKKQRMMEQVVRALDMGHLDTARKFLGALLETYPNDVPVLRLMVRHAGMRGDLDEEADYRERILHATGHSDRERVDLGLLLCNRDTWRRPPGLSGPIAIRPWKRCGAYRSRCHPLAPGTDGGLPIGA